MYNLKTFEEAVNKLTPDKIKVLSFNNDNIKKEWCEKNQYTLLSISYIDFNSIEEILKAQRLF